MYEAVCEMTRPIAVAVGSEAPPSDSGEDSTVIGSPEQVKVDQESGIAPPDSSVEQNPSAMRADKIFPSEKPEENVQPRSSLLHCIIGNALILIVFIFIGGVFNLVRPPLLPCAVVWVKVPSSAVTLLMAFHLLWRFSNLDATGFENPFIKILIPVIEQLHPRKLPVSILLSTTIFLFFWIGILQWHPPRSVIIEEPVPVIDKLEVRFLDGTTGSYKSGDGIQMQPGSSIMVIGVILSGDNASCEWSANGGSLSPMTGCSTQYTLPIGLKQDALELRVASFCGRWETRALFHIQVQDEEHQPDQSPGPPANRQERGTHPPVKEQSGDSWESTNQDITQSRNDIKEILEQARIRLGKNNAEACRLYMEAFNKLPPEAKANVDVREARSQYENHQYPVAARLFEKAFEGFVNR